jgi:hypothetical protein
MMLVAVAGSLGYVVSMFTALAVGHSLAVALRR